MLLLALWQPSWSWVSLYTTLLQPCVSCHHLLSEAFYLLCGVYKVGRLLGPVFTEYDAV